MMKQIKNQSGVAILQALMVTALVGVAAGLIMSEMRLTETTLMIPRIRSEMMIAESAFRNVAYMSVIYSTANVVGGKASDAAPIAASLNTFLGDFESDLPNCTPSPCGIRFVGTAGNKFTWNEDTTSSPPDTIYKLETRIEYSGTGVSGKTVNVKPIILSIVIPENILTGAPFQCAAVNVNTPFFRGFEPDGDPICHGWSGANQVNGRCNPGYYMKSFDHTQMTINCVELVTPGGNSCGAGEYISSLTWGLNGSVVKACVARPNPFTYFSTPAPGIAWGM